MPEGFSQCGGCDNCARIAWHLQEALAAQAQQEEGKPDASAGTPRAAFAVGDAVRVRRYGLGMVTAADALSVTVEFKNGEQRCFLPEWVSRATTRRKTGQPTAVR